MHILYLGARIYPFIGIGLLVLTLQLGIYYKNKSPGLKWAMWCSTGFFGLTSILWVIFRGDLHSDQWIHYVFY